jgi:hypothetical protein
LLLSIAIKAFIHCRLVVVTEAEMEAVIGRVSSDPLFKGCYEKSEQTVLYHNQIDAVKQTICKEIFMRMPVVMYAKKHFFLMPEINEQIKLLNANGLIRHWHDSNVDRRKLMSKETALPKVLKLHNLLGCFQILILGCLVSLAVFIIEVCHAKVRARA